MWVWPLVAVAFVVVFAPVALGFAVVLSGADTRSSPSGAEAAPAVPASLVAPAEIVGLPRIDDAQTRQQLEAFTTAMYMFADHELLAYGDDVPQLVVLAGRSDTAITPAEQRDFRDGAVDGLRQTLPSLELRESEPLSPGGWLGCGFATEQSLTICAASDSATAVITYVSGDVPEPEALARTALSAVVRRD